MKRCGKTNIIISIIATLNLIMICTVIALMYHNAYEYKDKFDLPIMETGYANLSRQETGLGGQLTNYNTYFSFFYEDGKNVIEFNNEAADYFEYLCIENQNLYDGMNFVNVVCLIFLVMITASRLYTGKKYYDSLISVIASLLFAFLASLFSLPVNIILLLVYVSGIIMLIINTIKERKKMVNLEELK